MKYKLSKTLTGIMAVALVSLMVSDSLGQDGRRGGPGRGGPGRGGPGGGFGRGFGGPGGPGGGDPTGMLLRIDAVQTELEVSPDQKEALAKLGEENRPDRGRREDFRSMSEEERRTFFEKRQKEAAERDKALLEKLDEVLLPDQMDRLQEISLQVQGVQALSRPEIAKQVGITPEQTAKLAEVRQSSMESMQAQMMEIFRSGDRDSMREKMLSARKELEEKVLGVLDSGQRAKFDEMKGEPFAMPEGGFGRGRGGFGGRGGPGGGRGFGGGRGGRGRPGGRGDNGQQRPQQPDIEE